MPAELGPRHALGSLLRHQAAQPVVEALRRGAGGDRGVWLHDDVDNVLVDPASDTGYVDAGTGVDVLDGRTGQPKSAPLNPTDTLGQPDGPFGPLALDPSTDTIYAGEALEHGGLAWAINEKTGAATLLNGGVSLSALYLALDPATQKLYDATGVLAVFSPAANKIVNETSLDPGFDPGGLVVDPASDTVYVLDAANDKLWALDGADPSTSDPSVRVGQPRSGLADGLAFDAATGDLYITNSALGTLSIVVPHAIYAPTAPSAVSATAGRDAASVRFVPPSDGGSPITSYTATATDHTNPADGGQTATITANTVAERPLHPHQRPVRRRHVHVHRDRDQRRRLRPRIVAFESRHADNGDS